MSEQTNEPPGLWNGWWTATVIAGLFTIVVLLLEGFGILHDWGLVLSGIGIVATVIASATASTASSVREIRRDIGAMHDTLRHMLLVLNQIRDRL